MKPLITNYSMRYNLEKLKLSSDCSNPEQLLLKHFSYKQTVLFPSSKQKMLVTVKVISESETTVLLHKAPKCRT